MAKSRLTPNVSDPKVLIGLSVFLVLIGGMAMNPAISFICFTLAGILMLIAGLKGKRWTRYIAFFLLIIIIALAVIAYVAISEHIKAYMSKAKAVTRGVKTDIAPILDKGEIIEIRQGTVANLGEMRIGLANVIKSDYTDDAGEKKHGLIANLVVLIEGNPPHEKQFELYVGQTVIIGKYSLYLQKIRGGLKGSVILQVNKLK